MSEESKRFDLSSHLTTLDGFLDLEEGWDGYCASKIYKDCYDRAKWIINSINDEIWGYISIFPVPNGNIQFECSFSKYIELELQENSCIVYENGEEKEYKYNYEFIEFFNKKFSEGFNGNIYEIVDTFHPHIGETIIRSDDVRLGEKDSSLEVKFVEFCLWLRQHGSSIEKARIAK